jgi:site-specific DNA recombinase
MRALIYKRVSTREQVANHSLDTQERACREHCRRHGLEVERVFRDEGESAKTANRPGLQAMLDFCARESKRLDVNAVVVYRFDRIARSVADHIMIRSALNKLGIRLQSATEFTEDSPIGEFTETITAAVAQLENRVKAERVIDGMNEGLRNGQWMWRPPLGYAKPPEHAMSSLEHDPERADLIRQGFEAIASGRLSRADALRELTEHGLCTHGGKPLTSGAFTRILKSPIYSGRIIKDDWEIDVRGDFEPIVAPEVFNSVQEILSGKKPGRHHTLDNPDFPLRRVVRCGRCSTPLTGAWSKGRSKHYAYYRCAKSRCGRSIAVNTLEDLVLDALRELAISPEVAALARAIVEDTWNGRTALSRNQQTTLKSEEEKLRRRLDNLTDKYLDDDGIDAATFEQQKNRLTAKIDETRAALADSEPPSIDVAAAVSLAQTLLQDLPECWNRLQPLERPQFLRALFPEGFTYHDDHVGTAENPWWINENKHSANADSDLVPLSTHSWNRVKEYGTDPNALEGAAAPVVPLAGHYANPDLAAELRELACATPL